MICIWGFINMDVTAGNTLVCTYSEWGSHSIQFAKSINNGEMWEVMEIASGGMSNPAILTDGIDSIYIFAQSSVSSALRGLVFTKSTNQGSDWDN